MRRIGILLPASAEDLQFQTWVGAFLQALALSGWTIGRNVQIDTRWAGAARQYHPKTRGGVGRARAEAIFAHDNAAVGALQQISRTVPIVFPVIGDPVAAGFIDSLARPGGNATGFMNFEFALSSKWLETIKQIAPGATRVAVLRDPAVGSGTTQFAVIQAAAPTMGMEATPVNMREAGEIAHSIESFAAARDGGLIVTAGAATYRHRDLCS